MEKFALIFPGQGAQYIGMGKDLFEQFAIARDIYTQADELLSMPISQLCFSGEVEKLNDTFNTQAAVFITSYAGFRVLEVQAGIQIHPIASAGHSLGEYSALVAANAISFENGLKLVRERGRLMKAAGEKAEGGMTAVIGADAQKVAALSQQINNSGIGILKIANDNCPSQLVLSGHISTLEEFEKNYKVSGAKLVKRLPVSVACHTPLMSDAQAEFDALLDQIPFKDAEYPIIANTSAKPIQRAEEIHTELKQQLCGSVFWTQSIQYLHSLGCETFLEIGPGKSMCGLINRTLPQATCISFNTPQDLPNALEYIYSGEAL